MTNDVRALKIEHDLSCMLQVARIEYEVARSQLALDYQAARRKLVAEAKAYAASLGIDPVTLWTHGGFGAGGDASLGLDPATIGPHVQDSTHTMEGVRHD